MREVHGLITAHEKSRGFDYEAVYFGRPDVLMFESLPARALLDDEVFMPRPGWGDFFFYMPRLKARKFSKMYTVAETRWGCELCINQIVAARLRHCCIAETHWLICAQVAGARRAEAPAGDGCRTRCAGGAA